METYEMLERLDQMYAAGEIGKAERCLENWVQDARMMADKGRLLTLYNEMEGLYRTTGRAAQGAEVSEKALALVEEMGLSGTLQHGTTLLNGATVNRVAGNLEKALSMYRQAEEIYLKLGESQGYHMASLYNNISQIYQEQGRHEEALEYLKKALGRITAMEGSGAEAATTRINMSFSLMALGQLEAAGQIQQDAFAYYDSEQSAGDAHYGSALSAAGELAFRRGDYEEAIRRFEKALEVTNHYFGENDGCRIIRNNLELARKKLAEAANDGQ